MGGGRWGRDLGASLTDAVALGICAEGGADEGQAGVVKRVIFWIMRSISSSWTGV